MIADSFPGDCITQMAKCERNDVGSLLLNRRTTTTAGSSSSTGSAGSFRLRASFSGAAFRRKIFEALSCGGASLVQHRRGRRHHQCSDEEGRSKLGDLLNLTDSRDWMNEEEEEEEEQEEERGRKIEVLEELKGVVKMLQMGAEEQREGASRIRKLAKEDSEARTTLGMLGAIPPLVGLLDWEGKEEEEEEEEGILIESLYALLNLGIGNDANKAAILKAGAVHKMLMLIESPNTFSSRAIAEATIGNFLSLSALDANKPVIGSSGAIPFLVTTVKNKQLGGTSQAAQDAFRALYNLSICHSNIPQMLETDLVPFLLNSLGDMEVSERVLMILSNMVATPEGRKGVSIVQDAFAILVDVLSWNDSPACQEKVSYILMVMAHKAYGDRQAMSEAGIVSALLELTLLGSTLAQKRASRILEYLTVDKGKQVSESYGVAVGMNLSAPMCGSSSSSPNPHQSLKEEGRQEDENMMSEERKAVKQLVQQSLQNNMKRIVKRANLPQDFIPSEHFKSLTLSSTSKSLPF